VIFNPITGLYVSLPEQDGYKTSRSFLGFDPIGKQHKVLYMNKRLNKEWVHYILTLGTQNLKWRKMICPLTHEPYYGRPISINGVLYYFARTSSFLVVSFDIRSEKFKFLDGKDFSNFHREFINYKGKLGVTKLECDAGYGHPRELCVWVLEDVENQEWSQYIYSLPKIKVNRIRNDNIFVVGMIATGEIVFSGYYTSTSEPFYVFYFNPEKNTIQSVGGCLNHTIQSAEIQSFGGYLTRNVFAFDYIEDLSIDDSKQLKSKPQQRRHVKNMQAILLQNKYDLLGNSE